jgi:predicted O-methyltransferase YrrM
VAGATLRAATRSARVELGRLAASRRLPPSVATFHLRARMRARRIGDEFSLVSSAPPDGLVRLLALAGDRDSVAELGTANGWTAIALALARPSRRVVSFDLADRPTRAGYLRLVAPSVRDRIEFVIAAGSSDPRPCELLYIDSSHEREPTLAEVRAWRPHMGPGAVIVFDDYLHPDFPGVAQAIAELGLSGQRDGQFFVHRV